MCDGETFRGQRWCEGARPCNAYELLRGSLSPEISRACTPRDCPPRHPRGSPAGKAGCLPPSALAFLSFLKSEVTDPSVGMRIPHKLQVSRCRKVNGFRKKKCASPVPASHGTRQAALDGAVLASRVPADAAAAALDGSFQPAETVPPHV